jgi:hypothetical protein
MAGAAAYRGQVAISGVGSGVLFVAGCRYKRRQSNARAIGGVAGVSAGAVRSEVRLVMTTQVEDAARVYAGAVKRGGRPVDGGWERRGSDERCAAMRGTCQREAFSSP